VKHWLDDAIATKKKIMGFGHPVYTGWEGPRATVLQELAEHVLRRVGEAGEVRPCGWRWERRRWGPLGQGIYPTWILFRDGYGRWGYRADLFPADLSPIGPPRVAGVAGANLAGEH